MKFIDISVPLDEGMQEWPESPGFSLVQDRKIDSENITNNCHIICDVHAGTHIDAPSHFIPCGETAEQVSLEMLIGPAQVIDITEGKFITAKQLKSAQIPPSTKRLLIRTKNSRLWNASSQVFHKNFVGLKPDAAQWLVDNGIRLVGIDYLSIQPFNDGPQTHRILLGAGIIIIEGLDLTNAKAGFYTLICLPLRIRAAEGAPARAVLVPDPDKDFS
jgi:arylformamidase